ncbi:MAG: glycosyltransferase family 2 protein, partial [Prevotellaceae bacterium]|nr:glycosyltransferase family 2 protein [Prevotellaceae bacterium]
SSFFAHNEEIDLCWRLRNVGRKICVIPKSVVYHVGAATLAKSNPKKTFLNFRNNLLMLYKNLPDKDLNRVMVIRWFLDYLAAWQTLLLNHNFADFLAIYKARRAFRVMCRNIERGQHEDKKLLAPYSILVKYYLKHKRKFSEL